MNKNLYFGIMALFLILLSSSFSSADISCGSNPTVGGDFNNWGNTLNTKLNCIVQQSINFTTINNGTFELKSDAYNNYTNFQTQINTKQDQSSAFNGDNLSNSNIDYTQITGHPDFSNYQESNFTSQFNSAISDYQLS